jgi:general stress protein 26
MALTAGNTPEYAVCRMRFRMVEGKYRDVPKLPKSTRLRTIRLLHAEAKTLAGKRQFIKDFMASRRVGVLATYGDEYPHQSLMAFAVSPDLSRIVLATPKSTRKFDNLQDRRAVSLLVDSRSNSPEDIAEAVAVTAYGTCAIATCEQSTDFVSLYLEKHPMMEDFVHSPSCALLVIKVDRYDIIERFQNVTKVFVEGSE